MFLNCLKSCWEWRIRAWFPFLKKQYWFKWSSIQFLVINYVSMHICFGYSMDLKAERRVPGRKISVFKRLGEGHRFNSIVCKDWLVGRCCRNPCRFLHRELPPPQPKQSHDHSSHNYGPKWNRRNLNCCSFKNTPVSMNGGALLAGKIAQEAQHGVSNKGVGSGDKSVQKTQLKCAPVSKNDGAIAVCKIAQESQHVVLNSDDAGSGAKSIQKAQLKLCKFWVIGNCVQGDNCKDLHSWFCGDGFSMLAKLEGHSKAVTGIALPSGSNKLYSSSKDKSVRVWDCSTGQCAGVVNLDLEVGNLISEGPLVFLGLPNAVKAWDINTHAELTLNELSGPVYAMVVGHNMLFVGTEDGTILAWKSGSKTSSPELTASLKGHTHAVLSLIVRAERLYSGSMDFTVRVWDLENLQCMETLNGHTNAVTSVLCWDSFLLSGSLDSTVKVWAPTETGNLEMVYEHNEKHGVVALCGIHDAKAKPVLLCSCKDNTVRLYEMPSFNERGRIFAKHEVRVIQVGTDGLFFTGDAKGELFVWKLHRDGCATVS